MEEAITAGKRPQRGLASKNHCKIALNKFCSILPLFKQQAALMQVFTHRDKLSIFLPLKRGLIFINFDIVLIVYFLKISFSFQQNECPLHFIPRSIAPAR